MSHSPMLGQSQMMITVGVQVPITSLAEQVAGLRMPHMVFPDAKIHDNTCKVFERQYAAPSAGGSAFV